MIWIITFYQERISHLKPISACAFQPTCSNYAVEALQIHGVFKGSILAIRRLSQCRPGSKYGGYDPVPEKGTWHTTYDTKKK